MTYQTLPRTTPPQALKLFSPRGLLRRQRVQLGLALLVGAILPFAVRFALDASADIPEYTGTSLVTAAAIAWAHFLIRQFGRYPGETPLSSALAGATVTFGGAVALILLTHMSYSRGFIMWGFGWTVMWYSLVALLVSRLYPQRFVLVGGDDGVDISHLKNAEISRLSEPQPLETLAPLNGVIADLSADLDPALSDFIIACGTAGIPVYDCARTRELMTGQVELTSLSQVGFESLLPHRNYCKFKSGVDMAVAIASLPVVLPLIALAALAIRIESRGPVFFVQRRVGYRGRIFNCYKLRSMDPLAPAQGPSFTREADPRITRVGRFIRKYRIDELPQVLNILKGEMSWIGPRPEAVELAQTYEKMIPFYAFRHAVRPGISGWAAVRQGNVAEVDAATAKLRFDFFYIKHLSLGLDAHIACKTVWIVLTGFGSR